MKKGLIPILAALLIAAVCLLPLPSRVSAGYTGWLLAGDGEVLASDVEITVQGWQFRYLFRKDRLSVQITARSSSGSPYLWLASNTASLEESDWLQALLADPQ